MKIFDCFTYLNEDLILDIRLHELNEFVDKFIIVESSFTHSGEKKEFNFNIEKFKKFSNKIIYIPIDKVPKNYVKTNEEENQIDIKIKKISNAIILENFQRNNIIQGLKSASDNDLILISDIDEIPNLNSLNTFDLSKILIFKQIFIQYKLNLYLKDFIWHGSKGCLKKNFITPQWMRNVKSKKYNFYRLDTLFSNEKYQNIMFIENGGWHFSNVMSVDKILYKIQSFLHHADAPKEIIDKQFFQNLIDNKKIIYDHSIDKKGDRYSNQKNLSTLQFDLLPTYIKKYKDKFNEWLV